MTVRIVDGTFTEPGEPKIVAPRPGARDILNPAFAGLWMRRGGGDLLNVYRALLDVHQHVLCVLSFDCLPRSDSRSDASTASVKHPRSTIRPSTPPHSVIILVHVVDLSGVSRACRRMSRMGRGWVATRRGPVARRRGWVADRTQAVAGLSWGVADGSRTGREAVAGPSRLSRLGHS